MAPRAESGAAGSADQTRQNRTEPSAGRTLQESPWPPAPSEQIDKVIGTPAPLISLKQLDRLDEGATELLQRAPLAGIGYLDQAGAPTSTFAGGHEGFATAMSPEMLSFRLPDGAPAPQPNAGIGMLFLFPGVGEVLRINGTFAAIGPEDVHIRLDEIYIHCSRAVSRAALWQLPTARVRELSAHGGPGRSAGSAGGPPAVESPDGGAAFLDDPAIAGAMANSPFLIVSSFAADGSADTSPRGDAPGFVHRVDATTLAIPDRKGNQRADTFHNLTSDPRVSLAALVPGTADVAIISGVGAMTTEPDILASMAINGTVPNAALLVRVHSAKVQQLRCLTDAALWAQSSRAIATRVPDMNGLASQHIAHNSNAAGRTAMALVLKGLNAIPGLMNLLTNIGLSRALTQEGYAAGSADDDRRKREARIVSLHRESADIVSIRLKAQDKGRFDFLPGQFFTVATRIGGRTVRRAYSASDCPGKFLRLSIKHDEDGVVSPHFHRHARRGDIVEITGPSGDFTPLRSGGPGDLVLIGAGSGITPLYSTIRTALQQGGDQRIVLIYGSRAEHDIAFRASLDKLAAKHPTRLVVRYLLTRPSPSWAGGVGRIAADTLPAQLDALEVNDAATYWVCGPGGMMDAAREALIARGVSDSRIHEERFTRGPLGEASGEPTMVAVARGDTPLGEFTVPSDSTVLDAGLEAGFPMRYSCTVGECGECAVKLQRGAVKMTTPNCLSPADVDANVVLTCIGRATEPTSIDLDYTLGVSRSVGTGFATWTDHTYRPPAAATR